MKTYKAEELRAIATEREIARFNNELELATTHYEVHLQASLYRNAMEKKLPYEVPNHINKRMIINILRNDGYKVEKVYETKKRFLRKPLKIETNKLFIQW